MCVAVFLVCRKQFQDRLQNFRPASPVSGIRNAVLLERFQFRQQILIARQRISQHIVNIKSGADFVREEEH